MATSGPPTTQWLHINVIIPFSRHFQQPEPISFSSATVHLVYQTGCDAFINNVVGGSDQRKCLAASRKSEFFQLPGRVVSDIKTFSYLGRHWPHGLNAVDEIKRFEAQVHFSSHIFLFKALKESFIVTSLLPFIPLHFAAQYFLRHKIISSYPRFFP